MAINKEALLAKQIEDRKRTLEFGKGNPYATLCFHCYGRHPPPVDEICPYDPPPKPSPIATTDPKKNAEPAFSSTKTAIPKVSG